MTHLAQISRGCLHHLDCVLFCCDAQSCFALLFLQTLLSKWDTKHYMLISEGILVGR